MVYMSRYQCLEMKVNEIIKPIIKEIFDAFCCPLNVFKLRKRLHARADRD